MNRQYNYSRLRYHSSIHSNLKAVLSNFNIDVNSGIIESLKRKSQGHLRKDGYIGISFLSRTYLAHRLVWMKYHNRFIPNGMEINHKNCNRQDNRIENLELVTPQENMDHRKQFGRPMPNKLSDIEISNVRKKYSSGRFSQHQIAKLFKVSQGTVSHYVNRSI